METHNAGPSLVNIHAFSNLTELFAEPRHDATFVDATHFQGNQLTLGTRRILKEPVGEFFTLHSANDAPCAISMGNCQDDTFGTVLRDPIIVMLIELAQIRRLPGKGTVDFYVFQIQREYHARSMTASLKSERGPAYYAQSNVDRESDMHLA